MALLSRRVNCSRVIGRIFSDVSVRGLNFLDVDIEPCYHAPADFPNSRFA